MAREYWPSQMKNILDRRSIGLMNLHIKLGFFALVDLQNNLIVRWDFTSTTNAKKLQAISQVRAILILQNVKTCPSSLMKIGNLETLKLCKRLKQTSKTCRESRWSIKISESASLRRIPEIAMGKYILLIWSPSWVARMWEYLHRAQCKCLDLNNMIMLKSRCFRHRLGFSVLILKL